MEKKYEVPIFKAEAFHCPHCETYAHQEWYGVMVGQIPGSPPSIGDVSHPGRKIIWNSFEVFINRQCIEDLSASICAKCKKYAFGLMIK